MKKIKKKSNNKKRTWTILTILAIIGDLIAIGGFIMMYGPWDLVRNFYINTAMKTKDHKYLANVFYSEKTIHEVMSNPLKKVIKMNMMKKF